MWLNGDRRFTWCAYDTIGIFAALGWDGRIRSQTPLGEPVELDVVDGRPAMTDEIVLFLPRRQVASVVDEWCPFANFFLDEVAARRWASDRGIDGQVVSLAEASELGARDWRQAALSAPDARCGRG